MVTLQDLEHEIARLAASGETLYTLKQKCPFRVRLTSQGYKWLPMSTGKLRPINMKKAAEVLELFNATGSLKPVDYQQITYNSSYYCAVLAQLAGQSR